MENIELKELKEKVKKDLDILTGVIQPMDFKKWVLSIERNPKQSGYYIVLRGGNPNIIHTCTPALHYWYNEEEKWSSETKYWLEDISEETLEIEFQKKTQEKINSFLTDEKEQELIDLFNKKRES